MHKALHKIALKKSIALFLAIVYLVAVTLGCSGASGTEMKKISSVAEGYIYASGDSFYDSNGEIFLIRGIGMENLGGSDSETPSYTECNEESYRELSELGFNTVRFYMNFAWFESSEAPYQYKEEGFAWLDQNLEWAEKYGIYLLFDMHYLPGEKRSDWGYVGLWKNENEEQQRLVSLWREIARRYADEPYVLGYDLVNEPHIIWLGDNETTLAQWQDLAQRITDAIRTVDQNHILFLEPATGALDLETNEEHYQLNDRYNLVAVNDPAGNVACEMHIYKPMDFTHMTLQNYTRIWNYPNENLAIRLGTDLQRREPTYFDAVNQWVFRWDKEGWRYVETVWMSPEELDGDFICLSLSCRNLSKTSCVYLDDLTVYARPMYTKWKKETIYTEDFSTPGSWKNIAAGTGTAVAAYCTEKGHTEKGCMMLQGETNYCALYESDPNFITLKDGYEYKVSVWVKIEDDRENVQAYPQMTAFSGSSWGTFTAEYLNKMLDNYKAAADDLGCPLFIGEFGLVSEAMEHGGDEWVTDFITLCEEKGIGYSYHSYHGGYFGLYLGKVSFFPSKSTRNEILYQVFVDTQKNQ